MPIQPTYPGVYIQEVSSGVKTITGVSTSIAAFFGRALSGPVNVAVRCTSFSDYLRNFGAAAHFKSDLRNSVKQFFDNGGSDCYIVRLALGAAKAEAKLTNKAGGDILQVKAKSEGAWGNNIRLEIVMEVTDIAATTIPPVNPNGLFSLKVYEVQGSTIVNSEPIYLNLSMDPTSPRYVVNVVTQSSGLIDITSLVPATPPITTFDSTVGPQTTATTIPATGTTPAVTTIVPIVLEDGLDDAVPAADPEPDPDPEEPGDGGSTGDAPSDAAATLTDVFLGDELSHTGFYALDKVDLFNLMIIPGDSDIAEADYKTVVEAASTYCLRKRAFLLIDAPATWTSGEKVAADAAIVNTFRTGIVKDHSAVFYPRIKFSDAGMAKTIGASGAIAGLMARTDSQRGVWKAPAGTEADLRNISDVVLNMTDNENGVLNKLGVNCIRKFPNGIVNWGARTLDGNDDFGSEWKYIPIRRLALFLEESLFRGTKWVVFEPNDEPLWAKIRMNLNAFMMSLFRQGAFQGSTPNKAFFVKCDEETTTQNDRNLGIVNIQVGFAPLKPAEFVIITIQQIAGDL